MTRTMALFVLTFLWIPQPSFAERPNFVIILCDDLGYGDLQCYGHPHVKTPNLNQMANDGIRFTSFYSAAPVCSPSRVGLLTGRSPNRAGVFDWIPEAKKSRPDARDQVHMREQEITIAQLLQRSGYDTMMAGKWHCNSRFNRVEQPQPGDHGFDHWLATQNNAGPSHHDPQNFVRNGEWVGKLEGYSCQLVVDEAINWLDKKERENRPQPFFIYLAFHETHEPVASPKKLVDQYVPVATDRDQAEYFANVENVDLAVGRLFKKLEGLGLSENTLVVFTSDNGPETLDRYPRANRSYGRATPLRGMKLWTTEAGFRVVGLMKWPKTIQPKRVSDVPVSALDLLPTFCSLADVDLPSNRKFDGMDLTPLVKNETMEREKPLVWAYYNSLNQHRVAMRYRNWKVLAKLNSGKLSKLQNVFSGNVEKVKSAKLTDFEIYDVTQDVSEQNNLVESNPNSDSLVKLLQKEYLQLLNDSHVWKK